MVATKQTNGVQGANFKGFNSLEDEKQYLIYRPILTRWKNTWIDP